MITSNINFRVTGPVSDEQLDVIIALAEEKFNALPGDVSATVTYETSGTLVLTPPWTSGVYDEESLEQTLKTAIANALGDSVHPKDIVLEFLPDGSVGYTVTQESFGSAEAVQNLLQDALTSSTILAEVQKTIAEMTGVTKIIFLEFSGVHTLCFVELDTIPHHEIQAQVVVTADSTNADQVNIDSLIEEFNQGVTEMFPDASVDTNQVFRTASPTGTPSFVPSAEPTPTQPTAAPSIVGLVVTVELSKSVSGDLNSTELEELRNVLETAYGVTSDEYTEDIDYTVSGRLQLRLPLPGAPVTQEELERTIAESLAEELGGILLIFMRTLHI